MQVRRGEIYGFSGRRSGKTTSPMLCGCSKPMEGEGRCLGFDILTESDRHQAAGGYMTQKFSLYEI